MLRARSRRLAFVICLFFALTLTLTFTPNAEASQGVCVVMCRSLNFRAGPGTGYQKIASLPKGAQLNVIDTSTPGWYMATWNNLTGYVASSYVSFSPASQYAAVQNSNPTSAPASVQTNSSLYIDANGTYVDPSLPFGITPEYLWSQGYQPGQTVNIFVNGIMLPVLIPSPFDAQPQQAAQPVQTTQPVQYSSIKVQFGDRNATVSALQSALKTLGLFTTDVTGYFGSVTRDSVIKYQVSCGLSPTGYADDVLYNQIVNAAGQYASNTYSQPAAQSNVYTTSNIIIGGGNSTNSYPMYQTDSSYPTYPTYSGGTAQALNWSDVDAIFKAGATAVVTDTRTGLSFNIKRWAGSQHADVEPLTYSDTQMMYAIYGGNITYLRRPVHVNVNGTVIAGSMYGVPHGTKTIADNGFNGQFCIHFMNSRVHGSNKVDADHQTAIFEALSTPVR